jgi:hypothetical protein
MCIYTLKEILNCYVSRNTSVFVCFLDASKAFDRVNHYVLFSKLIDAKFPPFVVRLLAFWYGHQVMAVRWGDALSASFTVTNGVKQGGVLSPRFYNKYTDGLSQMLNKLNLGCKIGGVRCNHIVYAVDMCLISTSISALQDMIHVCCRYAAEHDIIFNIRKTRCVYFARSSIRNDVASIELNGTELSIVDDEKYLGHIISSDLNDTTDLKRQTRVFYGKLNTIVRNFASCSLGVKISIFKSFCSSIYCNSVWSFFLVSDMKKLNVAYNTCIRKLFNLPYCTSISEWCVQNAVPTFLYIRRRSIFSLGARVGTSSNILVQAVYGLRKIYKSPFWGVYADLLLCN